MEHCYGYAPSDQKDVTEIGSPVNQLLPVDSGRSIMSNIAVRIRGASVHDLTMRRSLQ